MGSDHQDSDRQDFLERQEARRRRKEQQKQQEASSMPFSQVAGIRGRPPRRPASDRKPAIAGEQQELPKTAGQPSKAQPASTSGAAQMPPSVGKKTGGSTKQPATKQNAGGQSSSGLLPPSTTEVDSQSLSGSREGRRTTALRESLAAATAPSRQPKPPLLTRTIIWGTAALCGLLILACIGEAWTVHRLNQQIAASQQGVNQLQNQNEVLKKLIQTLQQPGTIEEEARKLGFIFPGDQPVVIVIASSPPVSTTAPAPPSPSNFWGFWPDWLKFFFGG